MHVPARRGIGPYAHEGIATGPDAPIHTLEEKRRPLGLGLQESGDRRSSPSRLPVTQLHIWKDPPSVGWRVCAGTSLAGISLMDQVELITGTDTTILADMGHPSRAQSQNRDLILAHVRMSPDEGTVSTKKPTSA